MSLNSTGLVSFELKNLRWLSTLSAIAIFTPSNVRLLSILANQNGEGQWNWTFLNFGENNTIKVSLVLSYRNTLSLLVLGEKFYSLILILMIQLLKCLTKSNEVVLPFSSKNVKYNLFHQIYKSGMIGLIFSKSDGKIVEANKAFLDLVGYSENDLKSNLLNWKSLTPPEFLPISEEILKQIEDSGFSNPLEKEYFRKDGSRIQVLLGSSKVKDSDKFDFITYVIDVSESKKIKNELSQAKEQLEMNVDNRTKELSEANMFLQSLIENIPNMIFVKDAKDLKFVRFNKAGEKLLGITREQMIGKSDYDFFPKTEAEFFIQKDRDVLRRHEILDIPEETITTSSGLKILHTKKIPLFDNNGKPKYLLGISEDITDSKKLDIERYTLIREQAAREGAEKNVTQLELLTDANTVLTSSLDYGTTLKNFYDFIINRVADWCHITIFNTEQKDRFVFETSPISSDISDALLEYRWKLIKNIDEALNSQPEPNDLLISLKKLNFKSVINVALKARGNTIGYILLATKSDSERCFDLADLQCAEELADRASLAIDNSRLFSEAQLANQLKDEFLATLSHELRTPLNIIHGYSELLKNFSDQMSEKERMESLDAIHRNAIEQTNIVNDILDVSRIITGKMSVNLHVQSPADTITTVIKNISRMAEVKNIKVISDLPKVPLFVMMDPARMQQIIWNLLSNALKFTPSGGQISIKNYSVGENCIIEVADNGVGINPSFLPYIFERFRQEDGSTTRKYGGLGLGLAIVRHLVEIHGGTIEAKSKGKNLGSQFILKMPIATPTYNVEIKKIDFPENFLNDTKILLVEDSRDNRLLINKLLSNYGAKVEDAESATQARKLLKKYKPNIILCDIGMPGEDGLQFLKSLRSQDDNTPVIALTAYAREEEKEEFLIAGFNSHVPKPVTIQTLLTEIKKLL